MLSTLRPLAFLPLLAASAAFGQYDLIIRDAKIVDGTGNPWQYGDVAVLGDTIAAVGDVPDSATADTVVHAGKTLVLAPGFIDVHTHIDSDVYDRPLAENFTRNGVTTAVTGNCGYSEKDMAEYFDNMTTQGMAINIASLIGHNTILRNVKGNVAGELTEDQLAEAKAMVEKAMRDGAVGMSTGLIYTPGTYSPLDEIVAMQSVAAQHGGIYASHMRSESLEILAAIDEALDVGRGANSRVQISHFKMPRDMVERIGGSDTTLAKVEQARAEGMEVWIDQYPYTASSTSMSVLFPEWVLEQGHDKAKDMLEDAEVLVKYYKDMADHHEGNRLRKDLSFAVVAYCRWNPEYQGLNLQEMAQIFALQDANGEDVDWKAIPREEWPTVTMKDQYEAVRRIYQAGGASGVFHTLPEEQVVNIMQHPLVAICSDSGIREYGAGKPHPRGYGSNARVLGRYVRELGALRLEDAIRKMTSLPATAFDFHDRGVIAEGKAADLVLFDPETVTDNATFVEPHAYSTGFKLVIVNGEIVVQDDEATGAKPGRVVYGPGWSGSEGGKPIAMAVSE
ncbi:MAG: D-aminoacylase [Sumerlaeia bacterium]